MVTFYLIQDGFDKWFFTEQETAQNYCYNNSMGDPIYFSEVTLPTDTGGDFIFKVSDETTTHFFWKYSEAEDIWGNDDFYLDPVVKIPVRRHGKYYVSFEKVSGKNRMAFWNEDHAMWCRDASDYDWKMVTF